MQAWPELSTKRSRFGQCVCVGFACRKRLKIVYPSGASAIAVPGWPTPAFCTASIARPRIVSIESLRISPSTAAPAAESADAGCEEVAICSILPPSGPVESEDRVRAILRRRQGDHPLLRDLRRAVGPDGAAGHWPWHATGRLDGRFLRV